MQRALSFFVELYEKTLSPCAPNVFDSHGDALFEIAITAPS